MQLAAGSWGRFYVNPEGWPPSSVARLRAIEDVRDLIERWRVDYNAARPQL